MIFTFGLNIYNTFIRLEVAMLFLPYASSILVGWFIGRIVLRCTWGSGV